MQQHVGVLVLRPLRAVALGVGVGRDVERVGAERALDVRLDVLREARIDLVQHLPAVVERPHLADRLVADADDDAADVVHYRVHGAALVVPVLPLARQLVSDAVGLVGVGVNIGHDLAGRVLVCHVVDAGADVDDRLEGRVGRHVLDPLAVDPHGAPVADRVAVFVPRPDHAPPSPWPRVGEDRY